ncbi:MAG: exopolyphosphatase / guanosine-5-triphosphate,3-diphosphate pyrophosphatase [Gaiellales bacterium]|nr:exopolyphosphatase / guanosine-5-triphosphate,3-diphosphate pyrophosphatase [Gaiellales bacterium]
MRVAIVDLGTNSTRLLVADVAHRELREVERLLEITRLGEGVDASGSLHAGAVDRVLDCLDGYAGRADALGAERRVAVATSAVRDATNRDELLEPIARLGFAPQVLSGREEAALTFAGVASDLSTAGAVGVVDVGGGSSEVALARDGVVHWSRSYAAGCVRMAERHLGGGAVRAEALARCRADLDSILAGLAEAVAQPLSLGVAVAGTATTAAAIDLRCDPYDAERIHGHRLSRRTIADQLRLLAPLDVAARIRVPGVAPDRAPVIVAGLSVLEAVLDRLDLEEIIVSERDILHGAALRAAA